jgi:hypothetical protein
MRANINMTGMALTVVIINAVVHIACYAANAAVIFDIHRKVPAFHKKEM